MEKGLLGVSVLLGILAIGYITLSAYTKHTRIEWWEKLYLSLICFFFSVLALGTGNVLTGGVVLSNRIAFYFMIAAFLLIHAFFGFTGMKADIAELKQS